MATVKTMTNESPTVLEQVPAVPELTAKQQVAKAIFQFGMASFASHLASKIVRESDEANTKLLAYRKVLGIESGKAKRGELTPEQIVMKNRHDEANKLVKSLEAEAMAAYMNDDFETMKELKARLVAAKSAVVEAAKVETSAETLSALGLRFGDATKKYPYRTQLLKEQAAARFETALARMMNIDDAASVSNELAAVLEGYATMQEFIDRDITPLKGDAEAKLAEAREKAQAEAREKAVKESQDKAGRETLRGAVETPTEPS